jgi:predicted nucleic acid-binding protein
VRSFIDTNVLVYTDDAARPDKLAAHALIQSLRGITRAGVVSTQVLQEYFVAATGKLGVAPDTARRKVQLFASFDVVQIDPDLIVSAIDLQSRARLSFWDALIVRAAQVSGCAILYTEDLQHDQRFDGVRVVNPFLA